MAVVSGTAPTAIGGQRHEMLLANAEAERDRLQLLLDINNAVVTQLGLANVLHATCQALRKVIRHDAASITLHDAATGELRLHSFDLQYATDLEEGAWFPLEGSPQVMKELRRVLGSTAQRCFLG